MKTKSISKNVTINGRKTKLRLEEKFWDGFSNLCQGEGTIRPLTLFSD